MESAKALLETESWVRLPANQVAELTGGKMNESAYLLRAVYLDDAHTDHFTDNGFNVRTLRGNVYVHHQMLGNVTRMKRAAIVVRLPADPKQLAVTCSTAAVIAANIACPLRSLRHAADGCAGDQGVG